MHSLWLRGAFGVRKSSFAFITNLGNTKPKLIHPVASTLSRPFQNAPRSHKYARLGLVFPRFVIKAKHAWFRISEVREKAKEDFRTPNAPRSHRIYKLRFRISNLWVTISSASLRLRVFLLQLLPNGLTAISLSFFSICACITC